MEIKLVPIEDLKFADYNPRIIKEDQVKSLKDSIEKFGVVEPVVVNQFKGRENVIVGGHQRVRILKLLGHDMVPVFYVNLSLEREKELNVRLNKNTGEWDFSKLANEFDVEDLVNWGFKTGELGITKDFTEDFSAKNQEIGIDGLRDGLLHKCPKCQFEF